MLLFDYRLTYEPKPVSELLKDMEQLFSTMHGAKPEEKKKQAYGFLQLLYNQSYSSKAGITEKNFPGFYQVLLSRIKEGKDDEKDLTKAAAFCFFTFAYLRVYFNTLGDNGSNSVLDKNAANIESSYKNNDSFSSFLNSYESKFSPAPVSEKKQGDLTTLKVQPSNVQLTLSEMRFRLYELFNRLNFNLVDEKAPQRDKPVDGEVRQNLLEFMADLFSFYKGASSAEDKAFCYAAFKWLSSYLPEIGYESKEVNTYMAEIKGADAPKVAYYEAYIEVLRRSIVRFEYAEKNDKFNAVRLHISKPAVEQFAKYVETFTKYLADMKQYSEAGSEEKKKLKMPSPPAPRLTTFDTRDEAEVFVNDILANLKGFAPSKDITITQRDNGWLVTWSGTIDQTKTVSAPYIQDFGNNVVQFGSDKSTNKPPIKTSGDSYVISMPTGNATTYGDSEMEKKSLETGDTYQSKGSGTAQIGTYIALTLAVHNFAKNPTSKALTRYFDALSFAQLINDSYFPGAEFSKVVEGAKLIDPSNDTELGIAANSLENSIKEFLKTSSGKAFLTNLRKAIKEDKLIIFGYASSEYLVSQGGHYDLTVKQIGNSQQRCEMAFDYINTIITDSGNDALGTVPFVPIVWPLENVEGTTLRSDLVKIGLQNVKDTAAEEWVRNYLESHYTDANLNANFQRIFTQVYSDYKDGNKDAEKAWNYLMRKNAVEIVSGKDDPEHAVFKIKTPGWLNHCISLTNSPIRKTGKYFDNVLGQTTRGSMYELSADMGLTIEIGPGVKDEKKKEMSVPLIVKQVNADNKEVPFYGNTPATVWCEGNKIDSWVDENKNVHFNYEEGKTYQIVAYAINSQSTISTGLVKRSEKIVKTEEKFTRKVIMGTIPNSQIQMTGRPIDLGFTAYNEIEENGKTTRKPSDAVMIFGVRTQDEKLNYAPKYIITPSPGAKMSDEKETVYKFQEEYVVLDRDLVYGSKTYKKEDLIKWAKGGYVGVMIKTDKGQEWGYTFDGRFNMPDFDLARYGVEIVEVKSGKETLRLLKPKTKVELFKGSVLNSNSPGEVQNTIEPWKNQLAFIPNSIYVPESVTIGKKKVDTRKLAEENILAFLDPLPGNKAAIYSIQGKNLGAIDTTPDVRKEGETQAQYEERCEAGITKRILDLFRNSQENLGLGIFIYHQKTSNPEFFIYTYVPRVQLFDEKFVKVNGYFISARSDIIESAGDQNQ